jgi:N-acetylglucosamine-6-phosphate deacetylase
MLLIQHAALLTPRQRFEDGALLIADDRIVALGPTAQVTYPAEVQVIDATGLIVSPGLIDLQFNGGFGHDFTAEPECIWDVAAQLPRYGVTSFLPTIITSPLDKIDRARQVWQQGAPENFKGALPLGLHLEGPFLNPARKGAHNPDYLRLPSLEVIDQWSPQNGVRLVTLAPELPGALRLIEALRARGIVVSAGHSIAAYDQALRSFEAGLTLGTHLFNAMPALNHREPGLIGALLTHSEVSIDLIADGIHVHPAMIALALKAKGAQRLALITDAMAALGMPSGQYRLGDFEVIVDGTSARLSDGTLAGSILTLDQAVRNLINYTGCTLAEALQAATATPASILGLPRKGSLEVSCDADLVLLTPDAQVVMTIIAGEVVYPA